MRFVVVLFLMVASLPFAYLPASAAEASPPDVMTIVREMEKVFAPERPTVRKIEMAVSGEIRLNTRWVARKATKMFPKGMRTLLVLVDPRDVRGNALLVQDRKDQEDARWVYVPTVRRVRMILPINAYEPFLDSDFTYADLGFLDAPGSYKLLGEEERAGEKAYKVDFTPEADWYYSHIVTWISKENHLPLERNYFDVPRELWKKETFEKVTIVNGIPTPMRIRMKDIRNLTESVFEIIEVRYDIGVPDDLFDPAGLSKASESPFWETLETAD